MDFISPIHFFFSSVAASALPPTSTSIYSSSIPNHPSSSPFNYSPTTTHYHHPSQPFFGWNNGSSLMRTHSASYRDYPQSSNFFVISKRQSNFNILLAFNPTNNSLSSTENLTQTGSTNFPPPPHYPSFFNFIPPVNFPIPTPVSVPSTRPKRSIPSSKKRPRLTAQLRNEILKLKANKPTIFVWEIQQNLLQNGICTAQTLPQVDLENLFKLKF